ncbi:T9SS type A sorting domain-containing protein [Chondrinema litorale]|uniref:T9SS type A sorting domain-containing protein n=1 Tax=Chondrinema litorale TaxID=2994555 RepID=UPI0025429BF5|nr:T9SS type A sorting domain-containing protein [Chondrinema litorale]UZR99085.1 T9SS type A sorting domain-containing protein [Chondrinema litorale]
MNSWQTTFTSVELKTGTNTISLIAKTFDGLANIDYLEIAGGNMQGIDCCILPKKQAQVSEGSSFKVYPNPSNGIFNLELTNNTTQGSYKVFSFDGIPKLSGDLSEINTEIKASSLSSGLYIVKVYIDENIMSKSILIK